MKYMLLIYENGESREAFFGPDGNDMRAQTAALMKQLTASGELVGAEELADPVNTKTVRARAGTAAITHGPLLETEEHFAGYVVIDCDRIERALEIAARWPNARFSAIEVQPIMCASGAEL